MAEAEHSTAHNLANGKTRVDFQTEPARYRHWKLAVDGDIATLTMDVDEKAGLFEGYELKLNSYDLGVDIELADAIDRLRFEHPQVRAVVLRSGKPRVFSAGANIRMLAGATHAHKVNFCKFTNETRNGIEDFAENSGVATICAINGTAAGGGYELALATDHIMLVDDGSAAVSLPELPLLAVLPGTGGLTRVSDKRKVRRDHADVFCTTEEGIKGKRAVEWRLVRRSGAGLEIRRDHSFRARDSSPQVARGSAAARHQAYAPDATSTADGIEYSSLSVEFDRRQRVSPPSRSAARNDRRPHRPTPCRRRAPRSGRCGSRANSTTRSSTSGSTSSTSRRSCSSRQAMPAAVLAYDQLSTTARITGSRGKSAICGSACSSASTSPRGRW